MEGSRDSNFEITEGQEVIAKIIESLRSQEFHTALSLESIGGNAGPNRAAINALVKSETGEIRYIGNETHIHQQQSEENLCRVVFLCDLTEIVKKIQNDEDTPSEGIVNIELVVPGQETLSEQAKINLEQAIAEINPH